MTVEWLNKADRTLIRGNNYKFSNVELIMIKNDVRQILVWWNISNKNYIDKIKRRDTPSKLICYFGGGKQAFITKETLYLLNCGFVNA